jgi:hypothetical protein
MSLLGAWLLVRESRHVRVTALMSATVIVAMFGMGLWSYAAMVNGG